MQQYPVSMLVDDKTHEKYERTKDYMRLGDRWASVRGRKPEEPATIEVRIHRRKEQTHGHDDHGHTLFAFFEAERENKCPVEIMELP